MGSSVDSSVGSVGKKKRKCPDVAAYKHRKRQKKSRVSPSEVFEHDRFLNSHRILSEYIETTPGATLHFLSSPMKSIRQFIKRYDLNNQKCLTVSGDARTISHRTPCVHRYSFRDRNSV